MLGAQNGAAITCVSGVSQRPYADVVRARDVIDWELCLLVAAAPDRHRKGRATAPIPDPIDGLLLLDERAMRTPRNPNGVSSPRSRPGGA